MPKLSMADLRPKRVDCVRSFVKTQAFNGHPTDDSTVQRYIDSSMGFLPSGEREAIFSAWKADAV